MLYDGKLERQRKCLDADKAIAHGYRPRYRAMMFVIGDNLIKAKGRYYDVYIKRKECEKQKAPDAKKIVHHMRAHRYMTKVLLRDLYNEWKSTV